MNHTTITLEDLPPAPDGKIGWPWTKQNQRLPPRIPDGSEWPRISIVTPSYNQGGFIEETIRSILLQGYPNLEYLIIDGGSTDHTIDIIKKYEKYISYWVSEPDEGQSNAINKGFKKATGDLIGWQNSDDYYCPQTLICLAKTCLLFPDYDIIYGTVKCINENGMFIGDVETSEFNLLSMLPWSNMLNQSMFFRKNILEDGYFIDESFHHFMDYDFFWKLIFAGYEFKYCPEIRACFRIHEQAKGYYQKNIVPKELLKVYSNICQSTKTPLEIKEKALNCIYSLALDNYGKLKLDDFQNGVKQMFLLGGLKILTPEIISKYILSIMGTKINKNLKQVKSRLFLK